MTRFTKSLRLLGILMMLASPGSSWAEAASAYTIRWDLKVPMRDGRKLSAVLYRPEGQKGPLPVIVTLTPYTATEGPNHQMGSYLAKNGYVFLAVDLRGRGSSDGGHQFFRSEHKDGYDAVEWAARQPWCNGKVGMWGVSYQGYTQWATAKNRPAHLATMVPTASCYPGRDFPYMNGVPLSYMVRWLASVAGRTDQWHGLAGDDDFWIERYRSFAIRRKPAREFDAWTGTSSSIFREWLAHPDFDRTWTVTVPSASDYRAMTFPILTITGAYDDDQPGALAYYREHMAAAGSGANHFLVIGPWEHHGTGTPGDGYAGVPFGPASKIDMKALHRAWYDWTLKGGAKPAFLQKRVAVYVQGDDSWRFADRVEDLGGTRRSLYLHSDGGASLQRPGSLGPSLPGEEAADHFSFDPRDPAPAQEEGPPAAKYLAHAGSALLAGTDLFQSTTRATVFETAPFENAAVVIGSPTLSVWVRMDVPDTDFFASIYEVLADGSILQLSNDILRTRYRNSRTKAEPMKPGIATRLDFNAFKFFARRIAKGSRLRLAFGNLTDPSFFQNQNSGKNVSEEADQDAGVAHIKLLHDTEHPSVLELPMVNP